MIIDWTRGHMRIEYKEKTVTILGESYLPGHGSPDFVAYASSITHWDPPNNDKEISDEERKLILEELLLAAKQKNVAIEIE